MPKSPRTAITTAKNSATWWTRDDSRVSFRWTCGFQPSCTCGYQPRSVLNACNLPPPSSVIADVAVDFAQVVADNQSLVFSIAVRFLRDREGAEELAQDVFLQLYRKLREIESPA